jgi:hypothetical protein
MPVGNRDSEAASVGGLCHFVKGLEQIVCGSERPTNSAAASFDMVICITPPMNGFSCGRVNRA